MTDKQKAEELVARIEKYFKDNPAGEGSIRINSFSTIDNLKAYVDRNIATMKAAKPFMSSFNACYHRLLELKNFLENRKK